MGRKGRLTAEINIRGVHILREFQQLTPYYSSITERVRATNFAEHAHSATWTLCALEARTLVNELGIPYGKKSRTIKPPRVDFSRPDYLRGIVDADGSLGWTAQGFPFLSLTSASTAIAAYLCHYAKKITGTERTIARNKRDGIYNVCYYKETAQQLAAHLYYPGCLALDYKRANADSIAGWVRPPDMKVCPPRRRWTAPRTCGCWKSETPPWQPTNWDAPNPRAGNACGGCAQGAARGRGLEQPLSCTRSLLPSRGGEPTWPSG